MRKGFLRRLVRVSHDQEDPVQKGAAQDAAAQEALAQKSAAQDAKTPQGAAQERATQKSSVQKDIGTGPRETIPAKEDPASSADETQVQYLYVYRVAGCNIALEQSDFDLLISMRGICLNPVPAYSGVFDFHEPQQQFRGRMLHIAACFGAAHISCTAEGWMHLLRCDGALYGLYFDARAQRVDASTLCLVPDPHTPRNIVWPPQSLRHTLRTRFSPIYVLDAQGIVHHMRPQTEALQPNHAHSVTL